MEELEFVTTGAEIACTKGSIETIFNPTSNNFYKIGGCLVATKLDCIPFTNILPFGLCKVTGKSCIPSIATSWIDTWPKQVNGVETLIKRSTCIWALGGTLKFKTSGQTGLYGKAYGCFSSETNVLTELGFKSIQTIRIGTKVWTKNIKTQQKSLQSIIKTSIRNTEYIIYIYIQSNFIKCSPDHPFFTSDGWKIACELTCNDKLINFEGNIEYIEKIEKKKESQLVYNLLVAENENYFVGNSKILVHNGAPCVDSDCTESVRRNLQNEVEKHCKGEKSACTSADSCPTLSYKMERLQNCISARVKINTKCFKGGDFGHNQQVQEKVNSLVRCQSFYAHKCGIKEPVPEKKPSLETDENFMKKMETITGLTGAALIIYLIFSEGSRLIPPRNLVPIP